MKKLMTLGLFVVSSALLIAACGGGGKPAENSGEKGGAGTDDTMRLPVPDDFKSKTPPDLTDADLIEKGKALYLDPVKANCIMCHGEDGKGQTKMAEQYTDPAVADLTKAAMHDSVTDQYLFWRVKEPAKSKAYPNSAMLGFPAGSDEEIWSIVAYVRSLKGK